MDNAEKVEIVKMARKLERDMAARRKVLKRLMDLDDQIRTGRKLLRDLTTPDPRDVYVAQPEGDGL